MNKGEKIYFKSLLQWSDILQCHFCNEVFWASMNRNVEKGIWDKMCRKCFRKILLSKFYLECSLDVLYCNLQRPNEKSSVIVSSLWMPLKCRKTKTVNEKSRCSHLPFGHLINMLRRLHFTHSSFERIFKSTRSFICHCWLKITSKARKQFEIQRPIDCICHPDAPLPSWLPSATIWACERPDISKKKKKKKKQWKMLINYILIPGAFDIFLNDPGHNIIQILVLPFYLSSNRTVGSWQLMQLADQCVWYVPFWECT